MVLNDTYKLKIIDKLDKQFIDREELKNKINKLLTYEIDKKRKYKSEKIAEDYKKEILELLK